MNVSMRFGTAPKEAPTPHSMSEQYLSAVDTLITHDPAVEETLELLVSEQFMTDLAQSAQDIAGGNVRPLRSLLTK